MVASTPLLFEIPLYALSHLWCLLCREYPKQTAARECYEETLGVLGDKKSLTEMLTNFKENNSFKVCVVEIYVGGLTFFIDERGRSK